MSVLVVLLHRLAKRGVRVAYPRVGKGRLQPPLASVPRAVRALRWRTRRLSQERGSADDMFADVMGDMVDHSCDMFADILGNMFPDIMGNTMVAYYG